MQPTTAASDGVAARSTECSTVTNALSVCRAQPPQAFLGSMLRYWGLQLPFLFLAKTTEQDAHTAWGIPEAKLLEVGLLYRL